MQDLDEQMSIDELLGTFQEAVTVLTPVADRAGLQWRDLNPHDDWERLAECAFDVFVRGPIFADLELTKSSRPLARYDYDVPTYRELSWIEWADAGRSGQFAFVRLLSVEGPFDTVQFVEIDASSGEVVGERISVPWSIEMRFCLALRDRSGQIVRVTTVLPVE